MRKILFLMSLTGAAECLGSVILAAREKNDCRVMGLKRDNGLFQHLGGSFEVLVRQVGEGVLDLSDLVNSSRDLEKILYGFEPDAIVLGSVPDINGKRDFPEKWIIDIARKKSIPTVQFVDSWSSWSASSSAPDYIFVIDEASKKIAGTLFRDIAGERIKLTGHPGLEEFHRKSSNFNKLKYGNLSVGYFTQINVDNKEIILWLSRILHKNDFLYIKKHPLDKDEYGRYKSIFKCGYRVCGDSLEGMLQKINSSITHTAAVGLKTALLGIATINVKPSMHLRQIYDILSGYPLAYEGFSTEANSEEELRAALDKPRIADSRHLSEYFNIEGATDRFLTELHNIIDKRRKVMSHGHFDVSGR